MFSTEQEIIIDRAKHPQFAGIISKPDIFVEGSNPFCGDEIQIFIKVEQGTIGEIKHQSRSCAICSAATDLLAELLRGEPVTNISQLKNEDILNLLQIPLSPLRLKCALLPLETLKQAQI